MSDAASVFERLKARGEQVLSQVSSELMQSPQFMKAMQGALRGKEKLDEAAARALKTMNIPTRSEFRKAVKRIEALEAELASMKAKAKPAPKARKK
jgi:polyhydroxyalkanoate synthesis regulator phasin